MAPASGAGGRLEYSTPRERESRGLKNEKMVNSFAASSSIAQVAAFITMTAVPSIAFSTTNLASANLFPRKGTNADITLSRCHPPCWAKNRPLFTIPDEINDRDDGFFEDDDDDEEDIKPYGNRSLAWTKRYRRLNPYEKVRKRVLKFGHRSKADWDECVASGHQGQYVPARPDEMYAPEWTSWEEFLGLMRPFEETRNLAVNVLGLKSFDEYILFVRQNPKRAEGLRIPLRPDLVYKSEWVDEKSFFRQN